MKAIIQRVYDARVAVDGRCVASIAKGLLVYLGVHRDDTEADAAYIVKKITQMRVYPFESSPMHYSVIDEHASLLIVSQFTVYGNLLRGNRPDFFMAAPPEKAKPLYDLVCRQCAEKVPVEQGVFGAHMKLRYTNDGPVTLLVESDHRARHTR